MSRAKWHISPTFARVYTRTAPSLCRRPWLYNDWLQVWRQGVDGGWWRGDSDYHLALGRAAVGSAVTDTRRCASSFSQLLDRTQIIIDSWTLPQRCQYIASTSMAVGSTGWRAFASGWLCQGCVGHYSFTRHSQTRRFSCGCSFAFYRCTEMQWTNWCRLLSHIASLCSKNMYSNSKLIYLILW